MGKIHINLKNKILKFNLSIHCIDTHVFLMKFVNTHFLYKISKLYLCMNH